METVKIKIYDGLTGRCFRANHNPSSPYVDESNVYEGTCLTKPEVGLRFRCGLLDTNIIARILEETEDLVIFETLSGSIYNFKYKTKGELKETIEMVRSQEIVEALKKYNSSKDE